MRIAPAITLSAALRSPLPWPLRRKTFQRARAIPGAGSTVCRKRRPARTQALHRYSPDETRMVNITTPQQTARRTGAHAWPLPFGISEASVRRQDRLEEIRCGL
jgi:hypothetical protein